MNTKIELSPKQIDFICESTHRWNGKIGATQCGKTHVDVTHVIPERLIERQGKPGLNLILGVTKESIERNVLEPMRDFWGASRVSSINSRNTATLFGQRVYCLGAEKVSQVTKLRGARLKYAYCDEIVEYNKEVFELLKSRLSTDCSVCDFTGNPSYPSHHIKQFIESDADVYCQSWTIFDNPFLSPRVVQELITEYSGTVYYDRYILGKWKRAEGVIYKQFADDPDKYLLKEAVSEYIKKHPLAAVFVGVDWGHNKSANAAVAVGITVGYREVVALDEFYTTDELDPERLYSMLLKFLGGVVSAYGPCTVFCDSAEGMLVTGLKNVCMRAGLRARVTQCVKHQITDRIVLTNSLFAKSRLMLNPKCTHLTGAFQSAVWDGKSTTDIRLDDGTCNVDSLDCFEYAICTSMKNLESAGRIA